jgi:ribosome modulation factor
MNETPQLPRGVYSEGALSFLHGLPREDCPYPPGADEREGWLAGWDQSARKDAAGADGK